MNTGQNENAPGTLAGVQGALINTNLLRIIPLPVVPENIAIDLKRLNQWVVWKLVNRHGKQSKFPYDAKQPNRFAKSNDPATWSDFDTALATYRTLNFSGIGFAFAAGDGLCGIDLDHVIDRETGVVEPWALEIAEKFRGAYIEISPSGTGLRIFCRGKPIRTGKGTVEKRIEVYDHTSPRYLTVTGVLWPGV